MPNQPSSKAAKRWVFTINNYTDDELHELEGLQGDPRVTFLIAGRETGESGTPHLQGYLELAARTRRGGVSALPGLGRAFLETAVGNLQQNIDYCSKMGDVAIRFGEGRSGQGARTDLSGVESAIRSGADAATICAEHFGVYVRYHRGIERAIQLLAMERSWRTQVIWIWGRTGTGKSRRAYGEAKALCNGSVSWVADQTLAWFDGWMPNSKGAILDDFDGRAPISVLLRIFDRYPMKVPIKGAYVEWNPRICWVTSNFSPRQLYGDKLQYDALYRRIDEIIELNNVD